MFLNNYINVLQLLKLSLHCYEKYIKKNSKVQN